MKNKALTAFLLAGIFVTLALPQFAAAAPQWTLQITNLQDSTLILTYDQLLAYPKTTVYGELNCYGTPITRGNWTGVQLSELLTQAGLDSTVASIDLAAQDGYQVHLPLAMAMRSDVIVAYEKDGASLPETLRLVVPQANGDVWISMLTSINMSSTILYSSQSTTSVNQARGPGNIPNTYNPQGSPSTATAQPKPQTPAPTKTPQSTVVPTNATQTPAQQDDPPSHSAGLPVEMAFMMVAVVLAFVLVGFALYRHRERTAEV